MQTNKFRKYSRLFFIFISLLLFGYIFYHNIAPFGVSKKIIIQAQDNLTSLSPASRISREVMDGDSVYKLHGDMIYFTTDMDYNYASAKIKIIFQNRSPDLSLQLGFQDELSYHYQTHVIDSPIINNLVQNGWTFTNSVPRIFQQKNNYQDFDQFMTNPPTSEVIGVYSLDQNFFRQTHIPNYISSAKLTTIEVPLRGKIVFYTYVQDEIFSLNIWKQDLNMYEDPDPVKISIYKDEDIVYQSQIEDDGITDGSKKTNQPQEINIKNPGPELPENGVYKVVIDASYDSVITKIETNLSKIIFDSPLTPISSHEVYPNIISATKPTQVYTDAKQVSALVNHTQSIQEIKIGGVTYPLNLNEEISTPSADLVTEIFLPKSDVILNARLGYFAFSPDQLFTPTKYRLQTVNSSKDLTGVNYLITEYTPPFQDGKWKSSETNVDLHSAVTKNGKLGWIIKVPGLSTSGSELVIKRIELEFNKPPIRLWN